MTFASQKGVKVTNVETFEEAALFEFHGAIVKNVGNCVETKVRRVEFEGSIIGEKDLIARVIGMS